LAVSLAVGPPVVGTDSLSFLPIIA
jgi:hypothetical protein